MFHLELSRADLRYFQKNKEKCNPHAMIKSLEQISIKTGIEVPSILKNSKTIANINAQLADSANFYNTALKRDTALAVNTINTMKKTNTHQAILITGGFHTNGIETILKDNGIKFQVAVPIVKDANSDINIYLSRMTDKRYSEMTIAVPSIFSKLIDMLSKTIKQDDWAEISNSLISELETSLLQNNPDASQEEVRNYLLENIELWRSAQKIITQEEEIILEFLKYEVSERRYTKPLTAEEVDLVKKAYEEVSLENDLTVLQEVLSDIISESTAVETVLSESNGHLTVNNLETVRLIDLPAAIFKLASEGKRIIAVDKQSKIAPDHCYIDWGGTLSNITKAERLWLFKLLRSKNITVNILSSAPAEGITRSLSDEEMELIDSFVITMPHETEYYEEDSVSLIATESGKQIKKITTYNSKAGFVSSLTDRSSILLIDDRSSSFPAESKNLVKLGITGRNPLQIGTRHQLSGEDLRIADYYITSLNELSLIEELLDILKPPVPEDLRAGKPSGSIFINDKDNLSDFFESDEALIYENIKSVRKTLSRIAEEGPVEAVYIDWSGTMDLNILPHSIAERMRREILLLIKIMG